MLILRNASFKLIFKHKLKELNKKRKKRRKRKKARDRKPCKEEEPSFMLITAQSYL